MRNRIFDKLKRTAGLSLAILLVLSLTAAAAVQLLQFHQARRQEQNLLVNINIVSLTCLFCKESDLSIRMCK